MKVMKVMKVKNEIGLYLIIKNAFIEELGDSFLSSREEFMKNIECEAEIYNHILECVSFILMLKRRKVKEISLDFFVGFLANEIWGTWGEDSLSLNEVKSLVYRIFANLEEEN